MLDETIITVMLSLAYCYGPRGEQVAVPVPGTHARRVPHGVLNIRSGDVVLCVTETWDQTTHRAFLTMIRAHWRGWQIVLFEDRGVPHTAAASRRLDKDLHIALRFLPTATPELNAMHHLWRHVKGRVLANRPVSSIDAAAEQACQAILQMSRHERLWKAGTLSQRHCACEDSHSIHSLWTGTPVLTAARKPERKIKSCLPTVIAAIRMFLGQEHGKKLIKRYLESYLAILSHQFVVVSKRWIVERTFGWFLKYCKLSKDCAYHMATSEAMIYVAMIHIMIRTIGVKTPF
jgi:transposase